MKKIIKFLNLLISWLIVLIPLAMAIAPAPMNIFMGLMIAGFLAKKIIQRERLFVETELNLPLFFIFLITCISVFNSVSLKDSLRGGILRLLQYIFVFFVIFEGVKDKTHILRIFFATLAGIIISNIDAIWQVTAGYDFIRGYKPVINIGLIRATASFKDANNFGIYLSALMPLVIGLSLYYYQGIKKLIFILLSILGIIGIILTYSRPTLLAIYVVFLFFSLVKKDKVLLIFLLVFTLVSPFLVPKSVKDWAREVNYNPLRFMCNDDRIAVYRNSIRMIQAHPVIGVGAGTFMKSYKYYKESPEYRNIVTLSEMKAHNNFLHLTAEAGLLGLSIFLWLLFILFKEAKTIYQQLQDNFLKMVSLSLSACLIAFLINGLTESSLYYSRVALIFWYLIGFSLALKRFISLSLSSSK